MSEPAGRANHRHGAPADAAEEIEAAIAAAGGAITFAAYMELALYGEHGFYTAAGGQAGRRGDFLTSPEVGPLFGAVLAGAIDAEWDRLGRPDPFVVIDAGAGPGTLARSVLAARPACRDALRYVAVERSAAQRALHPEGVESVAALPAGPVDGVVVANELLDDLPFRLAVHDGGWREAMVAVGPDGALVEELAPMPSPPAVLPAGGPHGGRAPLLDAASAWVDEARATLRRGRVVAIDYARPTTATMAGLPWRDWLRTYRGNGRGGHYLAAPGTQDITTDVAVDQLPAPEAVRSQRQYLQRWGIDDLVAEGAAAWQRAAAHPDLPALAMRSRAREAEALLDPRGPGGFTVLEWEPGCRSGADSAD